MSLSMDVDRATEIRLRIEILDYQLSYFIHDNYNPMNNQLNVFSFFHIGTLHKKRTFAIRTRESINYKRKICKINAECLLHYGHPKCLL